MTSNSPYNYHCCFQVSVGTLIAFTMVAISVLILRYVPPDEIPLPSSLHGSIEHVSSSSSICSKEIEVEKQTDHIGSSKDMVVVEYPLLQKLIGVGEGNLYSLFIQHLKSL